jgi:L-alanine-DL-glutamate epimerase-like enolase superfamily enzyme
LKITRIEPIILGDPIPHRCTVLVKVYTDEGITGVGECSPMNAEADKIAGQTQAMCGAGIEIACWDIMGKALNQPIYKLLGGAYRTKIGVYASSMQRDIAPNDEARRMYDLREKYGFRGGKVRAGVNYGFDQDVAPGRAVAVVKSVRQAMGDDFQLMVDANSCYSAARAIELGRRYEQLGVWHFEEPVPYFDVDSQAKVAHALDMPVAAGENDWDLFRFKEMFVKQAVDIVQQDIIKCYGFLHAKKIAALAEAFGVFVAPHNSQPNLGTVATLHFVAATPGCRYLQEMSIESFSRREGLFEPRIEVVDGYVRVPDGPGLGVKINEKAIEAMRTA